MLLPLVLFGKVKDLKSVILLENRVYINPFQPAVHFEYKSSHRMCSVKKLLLKISPSLQENTCVGVSF